MTNPTTSGEKILFAGMRSLSYGIALVTAVGLGAIAVTMVRMLTGL